MLEIKLWYFLSLKCSIVQKKCHICGEKYHNKYLTIIQSKNFKNLYQKKETITLNRPYYYRLFYLNQSCLSLEKW